MVHKLTGETMVIKKLLTCDEEGTKTLLKEVSNFLCYF